MMKNVGNENVSFDQDCTGKLMKNRVLNITERKENQPKLQEVLSLLNQTRKRMKL